MVFLCDVTVTLSAQYLSRAIIIYIFYNNMNDEVVSIMMNSVRNYLAISEPRTPICSNLRKQLITFNLNVISVSDFVEVIIMDHNNVT